MALYGVVFLITPQIIKREAAGKIGKRNSQFQYFANPLFSVMFSLIIANDYIAALRPLFLTVAMGSETLPPTHATIPCLLFLPA